MKKEMIDSLGLSAFCENMAMMLKAGIQTDEALSLLVEENGSHGVLTEALRVAAQLVENGSSVSEALAETGVFPEYMIQTFAQGERYGQTEDVFYQMASYYSGQHTISQKLKTLIRYPVVMMITIAAVLAVMLYKVLPVFSGVYESMTGSLAGSAYSFVRVSYVICWIAFAALLLVLALVLICLLLWPTKGGGAFLRKLLEKLPATSGIMEHLGLYRFMTSLRISLTAGETQDTAVENGVEVTRCAAVEEKLKACLKRMEEEGEGVAQAAYRVNLLEPIYGRMFLSGVRSGNMDSVLLRLGELIQDSLMEKVDRLSGLLEPILSGAMMLTVGLSLLSVMLPLIGMMSSIG